MDVFKQFVENNRIFGYKGKLPLIRDIIDEHTSKKFENLFYSLNILYEEINSLDSQRRDNDIFKGKKKFSSLNQNELQIYQKYFEISENSDNNSNISEFNENQQLLELALDEINNENYLLDLEIEKIEEEIALNEQLLSNEVTDNDLLKKKKNNINNYNSEFFEHKIENYKKDNIDIIKQDTIILNKSLNNIGTELDLNIKKSALLKDTQSQTYIVGYRKINNFQFDEIIKLLIDIIYQFEFNYDKIQRKIKLENEEKKSNNLNNDIFSKYMKDINIIEEQMKKVMMADIELNKNKFLNYIKKSKIIYENNLLKEFLQNPSCLNDYYQKYIESNKKHKNDMSSGGITVNLSKKIKQVFNNEEIEIYNKYIQIKNVYIQKILDKYLSLKFQDQITFIENMDKFEKILNSIYPYIIDDEKVTQLIYDSICEVAEIYSVYQSKIGIKQNFLRQKYSKIVEPINKITIDERDDVLLKLASEYFKENEEIEEIGNYNKYKDKNKKNNTKALASVNNNYHIYEIKKIIDKLISMFKNLKSNQLNEIIDKIYSEIISNFKEIIPLMKVFLNNQDFLIEVKKLNKEFKDYKDITKYIIYEFNDNIDKIIIKKDLMSKSNLAVLSIYDALFLYFFHRDVYNRELGNINFLFNSKFKNI